MNYRWIITKDHIADNSEPEQSNCNAKGVQGPRYGDPTLDTNPKDFQMYDDDGNLYYDGTIFGKYEGFEPLDDFGMPNAGCTGIKYDGEFL